MAMNTGPRGGVIAAIDVTPMADVMIVLLVIFMLTAPLIDDDGVRLPLARHGAEQHEAPVIVTLRADGSVSLDGIPLALLSELGPRLGERFAEGASSAIVQLRADQALDYLAVQRVLDTIRAAGAADVALVTAPALS